MRRWITAIRTDPMAILSESAAGEDHEKVDVNMRKIDSHEAYAYE